MTEEAAKPARKPRKPAAKKPAEGLMKALAFLEPATNDTFDYQRYVRLINNWAIVFDGSIAMGHPIEEDLILCPHLARLKEALGRAGTTLAINATDNGRLSVSGASFRAVVPCLPGEALPPVMPDPNVAAVDDRLKEGFKAVVALAKDEADRVVEATVLLRANSIVGTNGQLILEYWHGIDLPPGLAIPQRAAKIIAKSLLPLVGFGFDEGRSATFYFENGAWLKTQLYAEAWPDVDTILNAAAYPVECPAKLFEALDAIASFSEDGAVHFHNDKLKSTYANEGENGPVYGASFDVIGLQSGHSFTSKLLKLAQPAAKMLDYTTHSDRAFFYNVEDNLRGVLMKRM